MCTDKLYERLFMIFLQLYLDCINAVLTERGEAVSAADLRQGQALVNLVDILWPPASCAAKLQVSASASRIDLTRETLC